MKKLLITLNLLIVSTIISAQCITGDCENGYGKMQSQEGFFEGFFKDGKPDKLGIMQYTNGNYYFGQIANSKYNGYGYVQYKDGQNYIGEWSNGAQHGLGIYNDAKQNPTAGVWENGNFKTAQNSEVQTNNPPNCIGNCINGYGRITYTDGSLIQAIFVNGVATYGQIKKSGYNFGGTIGLNF